MKKKTQVDLLATGSARNATKSASPWNLQISPDVQERMLWSLWAADWLADLGVAFLTGTAVGMFIMAAVLYAYG